jgi:hypothetical protein
MRIVSIIFSLFIIASAALAEQPAPSADEVARRAFNIIGGDGAWERARYFSFTFNVIRDGKVVSSFPQKWDRITGRYQVRGKGFDGTPFEATINVLKHTGHGSIQGRAVTDSRELKSLYDAAYLRFANDTFFLLMPLKIFDPEVQRSYDGQRADTCGRTWDLLKLTVNEGAASTPPGLHWPWINRDTGIVEEWDMKLTAMTPNDLPVQVMFHDYRRIGGLLISLRREIRGKNQIVQLDDLQILPQVPKGAFGE